MTIAGASSNSAKSIARDAKKTNSYINAAGADETRSYIFLDNGSVIGTNMSVWGLLHRIEKANSFLFGNQAIKKGTLKAYEYVNPLNEPISGDGSEDAPIESGVTEEEMDDTDSIIESIMNCDEEEEPEDVHIVRRES